MDIITQYLNKYNNLEGGDNKGNLMFSEAGYSNIFNVV